MKKVSVIGHFAFGLEYLDGQTVKTKVLTGELCRRFSNEQVLKIDTHGGFKSLLKAPFQVLKALRHTENVIILPAHNGLRVFGILLPLFRRFFKNRKLHYAVIGGWLSDFLKNKRVLKRALKSFDYIYVETNTMKKALNEQGFENIIVMPNCKELSIIEPSDLVYPTSEPYKLCTFSRVSKEKGIEDAVNAVNTVNEKLGRVVYTLDIYGQVYSDQAEWFNSLQKKFPACVKYGGLVPFDKSVEVLKNYFALLFPTHHYTEGIPGTIIDAYAAGVPVISARWESFADIIDGGITGIGYDMLDFEELVRILTKIANDKSQILELKLNCLAKSKFYMPESTFDIIVIRINEK